MGRRTRVVISDLELPSNAPVQRWLLSVRKSSRKVYLSWFQRYLAWSGETPELLLRKSVDRIWLDINLKSWYQELRKQGLAPSSRSTGYSAARSYFRWKDVIPPKAPRETRGGAAFESDRIYTQDEIRKMLAHASCIRDEALLLFLAHSPQRDEVLSCLKWHMVADQVKRGGIAVISIPSELLDEEGENRNKAATKYRFAIGSEVTSKLAEMMQERIAVGEYVRPESWLFRSYSVYRSRNPVPIAKDSESVQISPHAINDVVEGMAERAGIQEYLKTPKSTRALFHAHGFRRYFKSIVRSSWRKIKAPIDSDLLDFELGHKQENDGAYDKFSESYIREVYTELEPFLSITTAASVQRPEQSDIANPVAVEPVSSNERDLFSLLLANQLKLTRLEEELHALKNVKNRLP